MTITQPHGMGAVSRRLLLGGAAGLATLPALAQQAAYPNRPVTVIVPFAPGGSTDFVARLMAQQLSIVLNGNFVADNRAGASGTVGHGTLARAKPDGYTLGIAPTGTFALAPSFFDKLPYDNDTAFAPISLLAGNAMFVCVNPRSNVDSLAGLIDAARRAPSKLSYGSAGAGTVSQLAPELMLDMTGTDMLHVSYRSGGFQVQALLAREIDMGFVDTVTAIPYLQSGELRALAVTSVERSRSAPQVPTMAEAGVAGYRATNDFGFFAPAGTPTAIVERLYTASRDILATPEIKAKLDAAAIDIYATGPDNFRPYQMAEAKRWGELIRKRGIKME